jgi:hypothetical protein
VPGDRAVVVSPHESHVPYRCLEHPERAKPAQCNRFSVLIVTCAGYRGGAGSRGSPGTRLKPPSERRTRRLRGLSGFMAGARLGIAPARTTWGPNEHEVGDRDLSEEWYANDYVSPLARLTRWNSRGGHARGEARFISTMFC